ncbi:hypothetical protein M9H77_31558 [Catharanthus roseus]|uniref:Uncharacterized protein n=1 Tax=Catharanthus roseus TaxID=4058 RepID=A0ACC0A0T6_CATRO|nr:hypothetical protein M9H77_31558 [Catharanthus roseus]
MPMLEGKETMKKEVVAEVEGQEKEKAKEWQLKVGGRDISFDDRMLNTVLGIPDNGIRFYTKNEKCFDPNLYSERRFEELFTRGEISPTKCFPYGCILIKVFIYFVLSLVGVSDYIGVGKIYNRHTIKRMGFSRNEEGMLVEYGQDDNDESDEDDKGNEGQEAMNMDKEESKEELEVETFRREMRQKKRQERVEEGQVSGSMSQLMDMIASLQASMNSRFDALDGKISYIQERICKKNKRCTKGVSREIYKRSKRSLKTTRFYKDEVIKSKRP